MSMNMICSQWHYNLPEELPTPAVCEDGLQQSGIRPSTAPSTGGASETECTGRYLQTTVWGQNEEGRQGVSYDISMRFINRLLILFSSPESKAQVSFSDLNLSVVCPGCCCPSKLFSRTTWPISTKLVQSIFGWR